MWGKLSVVWWGGDQRTSVRGRTAPRHFPIGLYQDGLRVNGGGSLGEGRGLISQAQAFAPPRVRELGQTTTAKPIGAERRGQRRNILTRKYRSWRGTARKRTAKEKQNQLLVIPPLRPKFRAPSLSLALALALALERESKLTVKSL